MVFQTKAQIPNGKEFTNWTVITTVKGPGYTRCLCRCKCGVEREVLLTLLKQGKSKSCGCISRAKATTHGMSRTPEYNIWCNIISRCTNPDNQDWNRYGGRGITISEEWKTFENFYRDMGARPEGMQVDREKNNLGYSKENCRWATPTQNCRNKNNNTSVMYQGKLMTVIEASEASGLKPGILYHRRNKGFVGKELFKPVK